MAKLEVELIGHRIYDNVYIDGKKPKFTKSENGRTCIVETNSPTVEIAVCKTHHYFGKCWLWWNLLYFIISIFGIFDMRQDPRCLVIDSRITIQTEKDRKVTLKALNFEDGGKIIEIECNEKVNEISNIQYFDKEAQKKRKKLKKAKILLCFAIVAIVAIIIILQQFDGNILGPKILGSTTGVSSFWVLFSILVGSGLFGIWGMICAVPLFAVINTLVKDGCHASLRKKGVDYSCETFENIDHIDENTNSPIWLDNQG